MKTNVRRIGFKQKRKLLKKLHAEEMASLLKSEEWAMDGSIELMTLSLRQLDEFRRRLRVYSTDLPAVFEDATDSNNPVTPTDALDTLEGFMQAWIKSCRARLR